MGATNSVGSAFVAALGDIQGELWIAIPVGLTIFGIIYGLGLVKKAGKKAAS
ncbi:hypothetical protein [Homoserinibacter sp. YIM 151385]|uniref:hypothetical protein n=1 Tax=Homoserinibacter sp. YIM 151385 TaxID=2985506 RepID=UPI0022F01C5E|nr:hypothetical protein [Homoserinibacter sp. YIM 151385]WBU38528.1 hypothetical protein OF852_02780 [Homoserinibacter sp. YIM 151385]